MEQFGVFLAQKLAKNPNCWRRNQTRDFIHVYDLVSAIIKAAKSKQFGQAYNLGSGKETTVNHIANLISKKKTLFLKDQENPIVLEQIFLKHAKILIGNQKFLLKRE